MHVLPRRLGLALAATVAVAAFVVSTVDQASAATSIVKIQNDATGSQRLNRVGTAVPRMITAIGTSSKWVKTDTSSGYATYTSVTANVCLTGRQSTQGFNFVTIETCVPGSLQQQWRLGVARDFQLRLNGLSAEVNLANRIARCGWLSSRASRTRSSPSRQPDSWELRPDAHATGQLFWRHRTPRLSDQGAGGELPE